MHKTVVLNVAGLTAQLLGKYTPNLLSFAQSGIQVPIRAAFPAVTCTAQATYLTGCTPREHGIIGNGWYFRDECQVRFWRQSNHLVQRPKIWDAARKLDSDFTAANLFWWYNMYSTANVAVTPRPMYPADGRKISDIYTVPSDLRSNLQRELGTFPLFKFWGPATSIVSSHWIGDAAIHVDRRFDPTLTLVYVPHLDYVLQRVGPDDPAVGKDLLELDAVVGDLIAWYRGRGARIVVLSEYGIVPVSRPVHLNRLLRGQGWISVREELGRELLDPGACEAFAVADHQIAHLYIRRPELISKVRSLLEGTPGVARVLDADGKRELGIDHPRSGELVATADPDAWFTYYYWTDDARAPDFARTVDIHRKPGYDPVELFLDPADPFVKARIGISLLKKRLGFRFLMRAIPLDASLVKGSHGVITSPDDGPILLTAYPSTLSDTSLSATDVYGVILRHLTL